MSFPLKVILSGLAPQPGVIKSRKLCVILVTIQRLLTSVQNVVRSVIHFIECLTN